MFNPQKSIEKNFIEKNYDWLIKWIENAKPSNDRVGMQIFKNGVRAKAIIVDDKYKEPDKLEIKNLFDKNIIEYVKREHVRNILSAAVFSIGSTTMASKGSGVCFMEGFLNKFGRLPTKKDKVVINYLEGNGITRWMGEYYGILPYKSGEIYYLTDDIKPDFVVPFYLIQSECKVNFD